MSISNIRILVKIETLTTCLTQAKQRCNMNQLEKVNGSKEAGVGGEWAHNSVQTIPAESPNPVLLQLCLCLAPCWKPCQADILLSLWLLKGREDTHQPQVSYSFLFFPERVGQVEKRDMWHDCPWEDSRKEPAKSDRTWKDKCVCQCCQKWHSGDTRDRLSYMPCFHQPGVI